MIAAKVAAVVEYRLCGVGLLPLGPAAALGCGGAGHCRVGAAPVGRFFTSTVEIAGEQPVIPTGPYAWIGGS